MNYFKDKKTWVVSFVFSGGILLFNAFFLPPIYTALGDSVKSSSIILVGVGLFIARLLWIYVNIKFRLLIEES